MLPAHPDCIYEFCTHKCTCRKPNVAKRIAAWLRAYATSSREEANGGAFPAELTSVARNGRKNIKASSHELEKKEKK